MSPRLFLSPAFHSMEKELCIWMEAELCLDGSSDGGAMGSRRVPREGLWEIGKAVKCLEAICHRCTTCSASVTISSKLFHHRNRSCTRDSSSLRSLDTNICSSHDIIEAYLLLAAESLRPCTKEPYDPNFLSSPEKLISMERYYWTMGGETWAPCSLGQGLLTSTFFGEIMFAIVVSTLGLVLFGLLIGNMQPFVIVGITERRVVSVRIG
ncbi:hypothetical protein JHK82_055228 [Glycine max]|nr:hypothetical protein JHK86_055066 [Glycine max]KAG4917757.1 hypothetical protein JHK85_056038 [Glycine max]KAG5073856.1 hypothetical protein JHK84_055087 [Glycine max]KAG5076533.1 hypothetical protein JHK82_055228 [Glycine max]